MTTFKFDGADVAFTPGQTVGAALVSAGIRSWRRTRRAGSPRGIFCGIGICYDCLIAIDGRTNERACLVPAADGMDVRTAYGTGHDDIAR